MNELRDPVAWVGVCLWPISLDCFDKWTIGGCPSQRRGCINKIEWLLPPNALVNMSVQKNLNNLTDLVIEAWNLIKQVHVLFRDHNGIVRHCIHTWLKLNVIWYFLLYF
jgi:hypothetical protein